VANPKTLLRAGLIGTVLVALCCFTPILVVLLGVVGLAGLTGYLDYVLLPLCNPAQAESRRELPTDQN